MRTDLKEGFNSEVLEGKETGQVISNNSLRADDFVT